MREQRLHLVDLESWSLLTIPFRIDQPEVTQELDLPDPALLGAAVLRDRRELRDMPVDRRGTEPNLLGLTRGPHRSSTLDEISDRQIRIA
ncbi:hypothetical protein H0176_06300 [Methylorubrum populi]|jgi:hypothetical protein|uniref:hypothetical protein n=1 Tax=Methylorubrum rhodesianum TaxID=29427 RepID=UPI00190B2F9E|nr:hypothetical protein [Methylorubrum rhodesianum]MBK3402707.1 hypothetical protein [Methylorubrum rhodesianum]MBY0139877.1 hypothetical protein [Methylorubrum populi]